MKAFCIFYGTKYDYSTVIDLTREFKKSGVSLRCIHIKDFTKIADILIVCCGSPNLITSDFIKNDVIIMMR